MPEVVLKAMCAAAWTWGWRRWACATLLCFYTITRIREVLNAARRELQTRRNYDSGGENEGASFMSQHECVGCRQFDGPPPHRGEAGAGISSSTDSAKFSPQYRLGEICRFPPFLRLRRRRRFACVHVCFSCVYAHMYMHICFCILIIFVCRYTRAYEFITDA